MSDPSSVISAAPIVSALQPYINAIVPVLVTGLVGFASGVFQRWTGVRINAAYEAQIETAAATEAGKLVAGAEGNLATASVPVGSPIVVAAVNRILASGHMQSAIAATGATPDRVASIVAGEIGKLQARMTSVAPPQ